MSTEATPEMVEAGTPDVVIVASGSKHIIPDIPGVKNDNVFTAVDAHKNAAKLGKNVVIIGGNLVGCETALYIQQLGKNVTILEMTDTLHADAKPILGQAIQFHLDKSGVKCIANAECTAISREGVRVSYKDGHEETIPADAVILAVGMKSTKDTVNSMRNCALDVVPVGDCIQPGNIREASRTGYYAALDIGGSTSLL